MARTPVVRAIHFSRLVSRPGHGSTVAQASSVVQMEYVRATGRVLGRRMAERDAAMGRVRKPKGPRGMWLVQLVEYLVGVALGMMVPRTPDPLVVGACAIALIVNAMTLRAGLAAFPLVEAPLHRRIGLGVAGVIAVVAVAVPMSGQTRPTLLLVAFAQAFISVRFGHGFRTTRP